MIKTSSTIARVNWNKIPGHRRPALWAAILLGSGVFLARYLTLPLIVWGGLTVVFLLATAALTLNKNKLVWFAACGLWLLLGAFRYAVEIDVLPAHHLVHFLHNTEKVEIFGRVVEVPDRRDRSTNLVLEVRSLAANNRREPTTGNVLVRVRDTSKQFSYGDFLRFTGNLERPHQARNPGGFDYRQHLLNRGIYAMVNVSKNKRVRVYPDPQGEVFYNRLVIPLRENILSTFREYLPGVPGALLSGYLIGETRAMPDWLYNAYRRSGTLHLLAVSGSNVWLVLGVFWLVFRLLRMPRLLQTILLLGILIVFCFVTRNEPSVIRAGLMAALILLGKQFYRRIDLLNIVGVSAVIIILFSPRHLFLAGFQLSYAAVLGIVILVPQLMRQFPRLTRRLWGRWLLGTIGSSVAATAATAPILAVYFGVVPLISVVANLVMVPLAGLITNLAVGLALLGDLWPWAARIVAELVKWPAIWSVASARFFEAVPLGHYFWPQPGLWGLLNYLLVLSVVAAGRHWSRWLKPAIFYLVISVGVWVGAKVFSPPQVAGEVVFLDAGNSPLIGMRLSGEPPRLIGERDAYATAVWDWIIEPFAVHRRWPLEQCLYDTLYPLPPTTISAELSDANWSPQISSPQPVGADRRSRYYISSPGTGCQLPVADLLTGPDWAVLILYQTRPELLTSLLQNIPRGQLDVLALPASFPATDLASVISDFEFHQLVLFGSLTYRRLGTYHDSWARVFSGHPVYSTTRNGGLILSLVAGVPVVPTIR